MNKTVIAILIFIFLLGYAFGYYKGHSTGVYHGIEKSEETIRVLNIKWLHERRRRVKAEGGY